MFTEGLQNKRAPHLRSKNITIHDKQFVNRC